MPGHLNEPTTVSDRLRPLLAILVLGAFSQVAQAVLIREGLVVFYGNEVSLGAFYGAWLFWLGLGSLAALRLRDGADRVGRVGGPRHPPGPAPGAGAPGTGPALGAPGPGCLLQRVCSPRGPVPGPDPGDLADRAAPRSGLSPDLQGPGRGDRPWGPGCGPGRRDLCGRRPGGPAGRGRIHLRPDPLVWACADPGSGDPGLGPDRGAPGGSSSGGVWPGSPGRWP